MKHALRTKLRRLCTFAGISTLVIGLTGCLGDSSNIRPEIPIGSTWYAIAANDSLTWTARSGDSKAAAESAALTACRNLNRRGCELILRGHQNCGAIAISDGGINAASAPGRQDAMNLALRNCRNGGGTRCRIARLPNGSPAVYGATC